MRCILMIVLLYFAGCSGSDENTREKSQRTETPAIKQPDAPPPTPPPPPAVKDNLTLIGAEITAVNLIGTYDFEFHLTLQTALPAGTGATIAEPGQKITVRPEFVLDESGAPASGNERNKRLFQARMSKVGDPLIGKIGMKQDGTWYLIDTGFK